MILDRAVVSLVPRLPRSFVGMVARRYISGDDVESALEATRRLNEAGMSTTLDVLGENITRLDQASETLALYERVLDRLHEHDLDGNISIKLSSLGLKLDRDACRENVTRVLEAGAKRRIFVRIDMEESSTTNDTLEIFRDLREASDHVGVVLQSRLRRSEADARSLSAIGARVRVCKGIYREPPEIAFQDPNEINHSFLRITEHLLAHGCHVGIATHDPRVVDGAYRVLEKLGGCAGLYEFQMLLGVSERLRTTIVNAGHPLRVYVPFGKEWYAYSVRRLRENPQIAGHVFRSIFARH